MTYPVSKQTASGVRVWAWTVNAEPDLRRMLDLGVDGVISDRPDLALRLEDAGYDPIIAKYGPALVGAAGEKA